MKFLFGYLILFNFLFSSSVKTKIEQINNKEYISLNTFVKNHGVKEYYYPEKNKFWIGLYGNKVIFSENCSYVKLNDEIIQVASPVIFYNNSYYITLPSIEMLLNRSVLPDATIDTINQF